MCVCVYIYIHNQHQTVTTKAPRNSCICAVNHYYIQYYCYFSRTFFKYFLKCTDTYIQSRLKNHSKLCIGVFMIS